MARSNRKSRETAAPRIIAFNKPFGVLSQFTDNKNPGTEKRQTLSDFINEPDFYPAGRLDRDSEGLLLLTNNGKLQARISDPRFKLAKTYLVQVEGEVSDLALEKLTTGFELKDGFAKALSATASEQPHWLWPRIPPVRFRKTVPDSWIQLSIDQGRNRQVRRMTAAVGLPTLRLLRTAIGPWALADLRSGSHRNELANLLK